MFSFQRFLFRFMAIIAFLAHQTLSERVYKQETNNLPMDKLDAMIHRLDQLERSVSTLRAQCSCETERFLHAEGSTNIGGRPANPIRSTCSQQNLKICELPGLSEVILSQSKIKVLCESDRWITVLQRFDGSVSFHNKNWETFKKGIGEIGTKSEFFIGLQNLHDITSEKNVELRFELEDFDGVKKSAQYTEFSVADEGSAYQLGNLGTYTGNAGDSFSYHQGQRFTTLDRDNDGKAIGSCGEEYNSAGWFNSCMEANIMGRYSGATNANFKEGMYWDTFHGPEYSLKSIKMSIRVKC